MAIIRNPDGSYTDTDTGQTVGGELPPPPAAVDPTPSPEVVQAVAQERANPSQLAPVVTDLGNPTGAPVTLSTPNGPITIPGGSVVPDTTTDTTGSGDAAATQGIGGGFLENGTLADVNPLDSAVGTGDLPAESLGIQGASSLQPVAHGGAAKANLTIDQQGSASQETLGLFDQAKIAGMDRDVANTEALAAAMGATKQDVDQILSSLEYLPVEEMNRIVQEGYDGVQRKLAAVDDHFTQLAGKSVDPGRIYHNGGAATVGLSVAVGALSQALLGPGAPNTALSIINDTIDRDIRAQEMALQNEQNALRGSQSTLAQIASVFGDKQAALAKTREILRQDFNTRLAAIGASSQSELVRNNARAAVAANQAATALERDKAAGLLNKSHFATTAKNVFAAADKARASADATSRMAQAQQVQAQPVDAVGAAPAQAPVTGGSGLSPNRPAVAPGGVPRGKSKQAQSLGQIQGVTEPLNVVELYKAPDANGVVGWATNRSGGRVPIVETAPGQVHAVEGIPGAPNTSIVNPEAFRAAVTENGKYRPELLHDGKSQAFQALKLVEDAPGKFSNYNRTIKLLEALKKKAEESKTGVLVNNPLGGLNAIGTELYNAYGVLSSDSVKAYKESAGVDSKFSDQETVRAIGAGHVSEINNLLQTPQSIQNLINEVTRDRDKLAAGVTSKAGLVGLGFNPGHHLVSRKGDPSALERVISLGGATQIGK